MAEIAASIVALSTFGIQLTDTLYKFGSNFSAARAQSNRISDRITDYTTILDILEATLEADIDIFSRKAVELIEKLCDQSHDLFYDIRDLLPSQREGRGRHDLSFSEKIMWNFRKSRIELLLGEIEYVKSNVLLLLMTALVGKKMRSQRRRSKQTSQNRVDKEDEAVQQQALKAKNVIVQHMNATENLSRLQMEADKADSTDSTPPNSSQTTAKSQTTRALIVIHQQNEVVANFQRALVNVEDLGERQALMIQRSPIVLRDLISLWTTIDSDKVGDIHATTTEPPEPSRKSNDIQAQTSEDSESYHLGSRLSIGTKLRNGQDIDPKVFPGTSYWRRASKPYQHEQLPGVMWDKSRETAPDSEDIDRFSTAGSEVKDPVERLQRDFPGYRNAYKTPASDSDDPFSSNEDEQHQIYMGDPDTGAVSPNELDRYDVLMDGFQGEDLQHMPSFRRSKTMPTPRSSSKRDAVPSKISNLKRAETRVSGYRSRGSNMSDIGEHHSSRRGKKTSNKSQIVDSADTVKKRQARYKGDYFYKISDLLAPISDIHLPLSTHSNASAQTEHTRGDRHPVEL